MTVFRTAAIGLALCLSARLPAADANPPIPAEIAKLTGCYRVTLSRSAPSATDAEGHSLKRTVDFFAELTTTALDGAAGYVVRENKATGFGRLFRQAKWQLGKNRSVSVAFTDGFEEWAATLKPAGSKLAGTATYTGDVDHPERHWSATASRYTCKRDASSAALLPSSGHFRS